MYSCNGTSLTIMHQNTIDV